MKKVFGERPKSPLTDDENSKSSKPTTNVTTENVTQVITDIIKENHELKARASTLSEKIKEEEGKDFF